MKISVLGTGMVGNAIANKLILGGHHVTMGSRSASSDAVQKWAKAAGERARAATFAEAAAHGEVVFNCTNGGNSVEALRLAGLENLLGKILIDVANPLDFSGGGAPSLSPVNTDSLGEQLQRLLPGVKVVKALNTMNCEVMANPSLVPGDHKVFICGNDEGAKRTVENGLATWFGWQPKNIIDLGDITAARATEMTLPLWLRLWGKVGHGHFNLSICSRAS